MVLPGVEGAIATARRPGLPAAVTTHEVVSLQDSSPTPAAAGSGVVAVGRELTVSSPAAPDAFGPQSIDT